VAGSFGSRIDELIQQVGSGHLVGKVEVDQIYAHYQHEDLTLKHPRGGGARYLQLPLFENKDQYLDWLAKFALEEHGVVRGMEYAMEHLSAQVEQRAPILFANLRHSGHPSVQDNEVVVYDRPPIARRLTEQEIREQHRANILGH
jgi:hypothetical protein